MAAAPDFNSHSLPTLPSYPEMIYAALDALSNKHGSNKTQISKHIESKYPNRLPPDHPTLLRHHLAVMRSSGELIFFKNNYLRPSPDFIRRGRGRPPKPKGPGVPTSPYNKARPKGDGVGPRPRGRPRKVKREGTSGVVELGLNV
ncbi:hypothetical protein Droror1_Dr00005582 [Drosera rotundifolia]